MPEWAEKPMHFLVSRMGSPSDTVPSGFFSGRNRSRSLRLRQKISGSLAVRVKRMKGGGPPGRLCPENCSMSKAPFPGMGLRGVGQAAVV